MNDLTPNKERSGLAKWSRRGFIGAGVLAGGGLLIGIIEQFAGLYLPPGFSDTSAYVLLLVMLLVRPQGLFATMQKKKV